jgi:hypothetical protein
MKRHTRLLRCLAAIAFGLTACNIPPPLPPAAITTSSTTTPINVLTLSPTLRLQSTRTPTPVVQPTPSVDLILDPEKAIAHSYDLLQYRGLELGFSYDNANYASVHFPNGDRGAFVAIGFSGIVRGYQFLYRIRDDRVELVDLATGDIDWGIRDLQNPYKVGFGFLELFTGIDKHSKQQLRVIGSGHHGTGLFSDGNFEIIDVTDEGMNVIFSGVEDDVAGLHEERNRYYYYSDLDADGITEIIRDGEECDSVYNVQPQKMEKTCKFVYEIYKFNDVKYVKTP